MFDWLTIKNVLLIIAATWHYSLVCGFVSDDHAVIERRTDIIPEGEKNPKKESYWLKVFNDGLVMYFLNRLMWKITGKRPIGWHVLNYVLHLVNCYLLYLLLLRFFDIRIATAIVLLWGVNPMLNQIVVWCSGRPYSLATMFALIALLNWHNFFIFMFFYAIGVLTSLAVGLLPLILFAMHPASLLAKLYILSMLLVAPFIVWKFNKRFGKGALILDREYYQFKKRRFNTLARMFVYYAGSMAMPTKMGWYHEQGFRYNPKWEGFNIWALVGYAWVLWLLRYANFGGAWFVFGMIPNMNLFATNSFLQDRYIYFGGIGLGIAFAPLLITNPVLFVAIVSIYVVKSYSYSRHMINDEKLYRENWRNHPKSDFAINNLAFFLIQQYRYDEAQAYIKRGLDICSTNKLLWYNLGVTWAAQGHLKSQEGKFRFLRAMDCWKMCLTLEPRWGKPRDDLMKLTKFLLDNKVLTTNKEESAPGGSPVYIPVNIGDVASSAIQGMT